MEQGRMNITEHERNGMRMFAARTGAKDVVTVHGSVLGGYYMLPGNLQMTPRLAATLLDAGTKRKDKDEIRNALASRGASIHFGPGGDRTYFSATCLPDDLDFVLKLIAECLKEATFPSSEFIAQKKRSLAELNEAKTDTQILGSQEFLRLIYDKQHVNYAETLPTSIKNVENAKRGDLVLFQKMLGKGGLVLSIVGDIQPDSALAKAERAFNTLGKGTSEMVSKKVNQSKSKTDEFHIFVADKTSVDVYMGANVPLTYDSPEYIPFLMMTSMLGGRGLSSGHLMRTIRERDGLTYGIYAQPVGFSGLADGALRIYATFSPANYEKAVEATKKEIGIFLKSGITEEALLAKKGEMTGRYAVGLGTTSGLASALHMIGEEGKPLAYLDEYPSLLNAMTVSDLKNAAALVPWDSLSVAAAGTFEKKK